MGYRGSILMLNASWNDALSYAAKAKPSQAADDPTCSQCSVGDVRGNMRPQLTRTLRNPLRRNLDRQTGASTRLLQVRASSGARVIDCLVSAVHRHHPGVTTCTPIPVLRVIEVLSKYLPTYLPTYPPTYLRYLRYLCYMCYSWPCGEAVRL